MLGAQQFRGKCEAAFDNIVISIYRAKKKSSDYSRSFFSKSRQEQALEGEKHMQPGKPATAV